MDRQRRFNRVAFLVGCIAGLVIAVGGYFTFAAVSPASASGNTLFVGNRAGRNVGCNDPGYTSVQAAVDAAHNGQTVYLCGGRTYNGPVIVANKKLRVTGDDGATIKATTPSSVVPTGRLPGAFATDGLFVPQVVMMVWGERSEVKVSNLILSGPFQARGCADDLYGVLVLAKGNITMDDTKVTDIRSNDPALYGCQYGVGIQIGRQYWPQPGFSNYKTENFVGTAKITNTTVKVYQKNGITIDGPGTNATVAENEVYGSNRDNQFSPIIGQNGIQLSRGAKASIHSNSIYGNTYTGSAFASAAGILIFGGCGDPLVKDVVITDNNLFENDTGIVANNYSPDPNCVAPPSTATHIRIINNEMHNTKITNVGAGTINNLTYHGYQAGIDDVGNDDTIADNTIVGLGYKQLTTPGGTFILPIDTVTTPTINVHVRDNDILP